MNGETIICSIISNDDHRLIIEDPLKLEIVNHGGLPSMMTTYWIPLPDEELRVDIKQEHVIMVSPVTDDMITFYTKAIRHARGGDEDETRNKLSERLKSTYRVQSNNVFH